MNILISIILKIVVIESYCLLLFRLVRVKQDNFSCLISVLYADLLCCAHLQSNTTFQCGSSNGYDVRNLMVCSLC